MNWVLRQKLGIGMSRARIHNTVKINRLSNSPSRARTYNLAVNSLPSLVGCIEDLAKNTHFITGYWSRGCARPCQDRARIDSPRLYAPAHPRSRLRLKVAQIAFVGVLA